MTTTTNETVFENSESLPCPVPNINAYSSKVTVVDFRMSNGICLEPVISPEEKILAAPAISSTPVVHLIAIAN
jgi:hypothetical protein